MNRLLEIGFQLAGHWRLESDELRLELVKHGTQRNVLYAFVCDGEVKYVGKTVQPLQKRMYGYQNPGPSQATNIRNHARLRELLRSGAAVDVLVLPDSGLLHYGKFHLNLAAGLEDSVISELRPEWNGQPTTSIAEAQASADEVVPVEGLKDDRDAAQELFSVVLHPTYFNRGFFNVPLAHARSFGEDGQSIEIFCGTAETPTMGLINRRANLNGTPRIMGGARLRDWFQSHCSELQEVTILVHSPTSIRIEGSDGGCDA